MSRDEESVVAVRQVFRNGVKNEEREIWIQPLMKRKNVEDLISCP
jgi:hypothetical protein